MISHSDYNLKLARAEALSALDPEPNSLEGRELIALAEELEEYERAHFPMRITKLEVALLRGGFPEKCNFCGEQVAPGQLEPEEAGDWVCWHCLLRWAKEDDKMSEVVFWERRIKEYEAANS